MVDAEHLTSETREPLPGRGIAALVVVLAFISLGALAAGSKLLGDVILDLNGHSPDRALGVGLTVLFLWLPLLLGSWLCGVVALRSSHSARASYLYTGVCSVLGGVTLFVFSSPTFVDPPPRGLAATLVVLTFWFANSVALCNVVIVVKRAVRSYGAASSRRRRHP